MYKLAKDHVYEILQERGELHASLIRDILYDRLRGKTPSIRELVNFLKIDERIIGKLAPAGKTQIKTWALKKTWKKK